jgi:hypothetical protein
VAAVQAALLPFLLTHATTSLLGFIKATRLSMRIQQVPVAFGMGTLFQSSLVNYGLLAAAALVVALILLLVAGGTRDELRGAGVLAALTACVLLIPLVVALAGKDFYIPRALTPAWIPLAVLIGAACTARRARLPGAALAVVLLGVFVYAQVRVQSDRAYQRPDWRGVAAALGRSAGVRAVVLYDSLGTDPLTFYLPRVPWSQGRASLTIREVDVVGSSWQHVSGTTGARLIATRTVDGYLVARFSLASPWHLTPSEIAARAQSLLRPAPATSAVLVQQA